MLIPTVRWVPDVAITLLEALSLHPFRQGTFQGFQGLIQGRSSNMPSLRDLSGSSASEVVGPREIGLSCHSQERLEVRSPLDTPRDQRVRGQSING
jgi:hypothetical protein